MSAKTILQSLVEPRVSDIIIIVIMKKTLMLFAAVLTLLTGCTSNGKTSFRQGEFNQMEFTAEDGTQVKYNLYIPNDYKKESEYPLVIFIHDAGALSDSTAAVLSQNGAKVWAEDEMQAKHPCFVLAPQFSGISIGDTSEPTPDVKATVALIGQLCHDFNIDQDRIYGTGQSMGCMQTIVTAINYPDLYAAMYLVAGQWEAEDCAPLVGKKIWIVVSEDDQRAYPGMNAITDYLVTKGASLFREPMNAQATTGEWEEYARKAIDSDANIKFTPLLSGTLPEWNPSFKPGNGGGFDRGHKPGSNGNKPMGGRPGEKPLGPGAAAAHMGTFPVAYTFTPILDWLFEQTK